MQRITIRTTKYTPIIFDYYCRLEVMQGAGEQLTCKFVHEWENGFVSLFKNICCFIILYNLA